MNTTEQTSDPTLWRYPSLWSPNRRIHIDNLESTLTHYESALKEALWLLKDPPIPFPYKNEENAEWYDRRAKWLDSTINKVLGEK